MLEQRDPDRCTISKTLSCFIWGTSYWELNAFKGAKHVAILEVEAESRDCELCFPEFLPVVREVTDEQTFDSYLIARELEIEVSRSASAEINARGSISPPPRPASGLWEIPPRPSSAIGSLRASASATIAANRMANVFETLERSSGVIRRSSGE